MDWRAWRAGYHYRRSEKATAGGPDAGVKRFIPSDSLGLRPILATVGIGVVARCHDRRGDVVDRSFKTPVSTTALQTGFLDETEQVSCNRGARHRPPRVGLGLILDDRLGLAGISVIAYP